MRSTRGTANRQHTGGMSDGQVDHTIASDERREPSPTASNTEPTEDSTEDNREGGGVLLDDGCTPAAALHIRQPDVPPSMVALWSQAGEFHFSRNHYNCFGLNIFSPTNILETTKSIFGDWSERSEWAEEEQVRTSITYAHAHVRRSRIYPQCLDRICTD